MSFLSTHESCPICLEAFKDGSFVFQLQCGHVFHQQCVEEWLKNVKSCQICRSQL
ncbi:hypothetical protein HELRODRAFT_127848, partial [Helobdella robusta]|uniref:RING-type domain-containing protein n=1 Tax=Helobdella robusta TaxID=6412 RepID=T1EHI6_HELRO